MAAPDAIIKLEMASSLGAFVAINGFTKQDFANMTDAEILERILNPAMRVILHDIRRQIIALPPPQEKN